jgi:S-adenosylmethionine hydrolase
MKCITLLSDLGMQDPSVASAKGILMRYLSDVQMIDISHLTEPFHLPQAAYMLLNAYPHFPAGTCHILLFDIYADRDPRLMLCRYNEHYFLAPDNGLLPLAFGSIPEDAWEVFSLKAPLGFKDWVHQAGKTAAAVFTGALPAMKLAPASLRQAPRQWQPQEQGDTIECQVIHIDRFENVVINVSRTQFDTIGRGRPFRIQFMRNEELNQLSQYYFEVGQGDKLCRFNSAGFLEICINHGKAASLLGLKMHREQHLIYHTIKIHFE